MAVGGNNIQWADTFPEDLVPVVLNLIVCGWPKLLPVAPDAWEEATTRKLREVLRYEKNFRMLPFSIWPESSETDPSSGKEIGRIDLRFLHGHREDVYLSFECKRLNYSDRSGKTHANFSEYTGDGGMMCYITQKYSKGLPHGGMIGYVLNGDLAGAKVGVKKSMEKNRAKLNLKVNSSLSKSSHFPSDKRLAESVHDVCGTEMTIYHIFLAN